MTLAVTDHAIVRLLERRFKIPREELEREVLGTLPRRSKLPSGTYGVGTHSIVVRSGVVVTVTTRESGKRMRRKR